uniref:Uncharacterized protein n=1 Tax=Pipistrellus kuhlii TaxID=59472 RepID=A0A7J7TKS2_PIPKU|nr:hypothetical protein mPipKuh1_009346 [Pipistrellus kuhlii]
MRCSGRSYWSRNKGLSLIVQSYYIQDQVVQLCPEVEQVQHLGPSVCTCPHQVLGDLGPKILNHFPTVDRASEDFVVQFSPWQSLAHLSLFPLLSSLACVPGCAPASSSAAPRPPWIAHPSLILCGCNKECANG